MSNSILGVMIKVVIVPGRHIRSFKCKGPAFLSKYFSK